MVKTIKVRVFYSWQSDLPKSANSSAIRNAIKKASKTIKAENPNLDIIEDEATRDTAGSPNIASKIFEKILKADIFVADISTITKDASTRACPNPNVLVELGFAVAQLGWDRIILLFNESFGNFPTDVPFDFAQHRISNYTLIEKDSAANKKLLSDLVTIAIKAIVEIDPKRPAELQGISRKKREHERDVKNIKWLMSTLHIPSLDIFIDELPRYMRAKPMWFVEYFLGVYYQNSLFSLYDASLKNDLDEFAQALASIFTHGVRYHHTPGDDLVFTNPLDMPLVGDAEIAWQDIEDARIKIRHSLDRILDRLRQNYIEVKLLKTNRTAWNKYLEFNSAGRQKKKKRK